MEAVQVCPVCGSADFNVDNSDQFLVAFGSNMKYKCNRCGNIFPIPLELDKKETEKVELAPLTKGVKQATPVSMRFGSARAWLYIQIVSLVLIAALALIIFTNWG